MTNNPILDELRRTREAMLAAAGGTLEGLVAQLQKDERASNRAVLDAKDLPRNSQRPNIDATVLTTIPATSDK